jgi:Na+/proline symporter
MIVGLITAVVWKQFPTLLAHCYNLVPAFALSVVSIVVISLLTGRKSSRSAELPD